MKNVFKPSKKALPGFSSKNTGKLFGFGKHATSKKSEKSMFNKMLGK